MVRRALHECEIRVQILTRAKLSRGFDMARSILRIAEEGERRWGLGVGHGEDDHEKKSDFKTSPWLVSRVTTLAESYQNREYTIYSAIILGDV